VLFATPSINPLNAKLNPICHLLALVEAHPIFHVSRIRVNVRDKASHPKKTAGKIIHTIFVIQIKLLIISKTSKSNCFQAPVSYILFCVLLESYLNYLLMQNSKFTLQKNRLWNWYIHNKHRLKLAAIVAPCGIPGPVKLFLVWMLEMFLYKLSFPAWQSKLSTFPSCFLSHMFIQKYEI